MQHSLSMYFRNQRRSSAPKTIVNKANGTKKDDRMAKKLKIGEDPLARQRNMDLLTTSKEMDFAKPTYTKLIEDTFSCRRTFIKHEAKSTKEILMKCPFLASPDHVSLIIECWYDLYIRYQ